MRELSKSDLNFVLARCPRDVLALLRQHSQRFERVEKPKESLLEPVNENVLYLAGGFIRATIAGERVSDIDLFGANPGFLLTQAKELAYNRRGKHHISKNAITIMAPPRIPVQFITRWLFNDPTKLIASFDFTVCQAVIWAEKHEVAKLMPVAKDGDGTPKEYVEKIVFRSMVSDEFYQDLAARRLVYTFPVRNEEAGGSFMRVIKFVRKGYNVQAPSLAGVIARIANAVNTESWKWLQGSAEYEKQMAFVVTGLLREVDPLTVIDGVDFVDEHEILTEQ